MLSRAAQLAPLLALTLVACARPSNTYEDASSRPDRVIVEPDRDAGEVTTCARPCTMGYRCVNSRCVPDVDVDEDGIAAAIDCDDENIDIGSSAMRECRSQCGTGVERCVNGMWSPCNAPSTCDCQEGDPPRELNCARCGVLRQTCVDGQWADDGTCSAVGECSPGERRATGQTCGLCGREVRVCGSDCTFGAVVCENEGECRPDTTENGSEACSGCGGGTRTRERVCDTACHWGVWGDWGACSGSGGECSAGSVENDSEACGCGGTGTRTRSRTCSADCAWGAFGSFGTCTGASTGTCTPGGNADVQTEACGACNRGRRTRSRTCDAQSCNWGAWSDWTSCVEQPCSPGDTRACPTDPCMVQTCSTSCEFGTACTLPATSQCRYTNLDGRQGANWQCCAVGTSAGWQFCLRSCEWSPQCSTTDEPASCRTGGLN